MHKGGRDWTMKVEDLARVEGEGALHVSVRDGQVTEVELKIFEPPRFFEALLRGRAWTEPPDITARICGICPVAYQMSACLAIEAACGVTVPAEIAAIRRLLYCGEWIESHALHVYLLHAPDFLGYDGAIEMARDHKPAVEQGLRLKKAGNELLTVVGGRAIHPVNVRLGGFYRMPTRAELSALRPTMQQALDDALDTVRFGAGFEFPDFTQPHPYLALRPEVGYPLESGSVVTSTGLAFPVHELDAHVVEHQVAHSTALHARLDGGLYATGPLARYALNRDRLSIQARQAADSVGLGAECRNPFRSILVRAVELVYACEEALRIIDQWDGSAVAAVEVPARAGVGYGATEAPRGVLFHRYQLADNGDILDARIVPPTAQNQDSIEADLASFVQANLDLSDHDLGHRCEQVIRNYDPCISCATHFLKLEVERA